MAKPDASTMPRTSATFGSMRGDVVLAAEAGVHGHDEHQVDQVEHVAHGDGRGGRVQRHAGGRAERADVVQAAMEVGHRLGVDDQPLAAGLHELRGQQLGRQDHQVGLERQGGVATGRGDDVGAERDVGDELAVHDVPLDAVAPGRLERRDLLAEAGEVGRQDRGSDLDAGSCPIGHQDRR